MELKANPDITFLLTQDIESPSGLGRYFPLAKNLVKNGLSVTITALHSNYDSLDQQSFIQENVHINYVAQMHVKKDKSGTQYFKPIHLLWITLIATVKLLTRLLQDSPETIVIAKPHPMNSIAGLIGGLLVGANIILDCDDYEAASNHFSSRWQRWVIRIFEDNVPKLVHKIISNTYFNQERMINLGIPEEKIFYLPNGIDHERFDNVDTTDVLNLRECLKLTDKKVVAYIGSLNLSNHPVDLLLKSFSRIINNNQNARLLIIGGGKDLEQLQKMAEDLQIDNYTKFIGRVPPEQVPYYYRLAHVCVDPVLDDDAAKGRCPLKLFESWIMETPIITSDVGDRKILIGNELNHLLVKPGDFLDLAEKISLVLRNVNYTKKSIKIASIKVKDFYWVNLVSSNLKVFLN